MTEQEFYAYIRNELNEEFSPEMQNHYWQVNSARFNSDFNKTYNYDSLWDKIQNIISLTCFLFYSEDDSKTVANYFELCARFLENIANVNDCTLDKAYTKIISALCYDLAGFQANAYCMAKNLEDYELEESEDCSVKEDNKIIKQIILILQKKIPLAEYILKCDDNYKSPFYKLFSNALRQWYSSILQLSENDYLSEIHKVLVKSFNLNNLYITSLLQLLEVKIKISENRKILRILQNKGIPLNPIWRKYLKLLAKDIYSSAKIKDLSERHSIYEFWISQICAVNKGLLTNDENFVVQMPTSAGKSFIAELFLLNNLIKHPDKHVLYVSPFNALSSEKENDFGRNLEKLGYTVSCFSGNYEIDVFQGIVKSSTDLFIATPEKTDLLLRTDKDFFNSVSAIVFDEGHIVGDVSNRGQLLEFLIVRLKIYFPNIRFLFISAVIPSVNAEDVASWLSGNVNCILDSKRFEGDSRNWSPTRKLIGRYNWSIAGGKIEIVNQGFVPGTTIYPYIPSYINKEIISCMERASNPPKTAISAALACQMSKNGQVLVFSGFPNRILLVINEILGIYSKSENPSTELLLKENTNTASYFYSRQYFGDDNPITKAILIGVGVHYGDLPDQIKKSVETDYKNGELKILVCTNTIGQGINFPIKNLIFDNVYFNPGDPNCKLTKNDYDNLVGRAGRAEKETEGFVVFVEKTNVDKRVFDIYRNSPLNDVDSNLVSLISKFIDKTITAEQFEQDISSLIDVYLIDLVIEEAVQSEDDTSALVDKICQNSLFSVQCRRKGLDFSVAKEPIKKRIIEFISNVPDEQKQLYKKTGLSRKTTQSMITFLQSKESIEDIETFSDSIIHLFLEFLNNNEINEILNDYKLSRIQLDYFKIESIVEKWIHESERFELISEWLYLGYSVEEFFILESRGFGYIYPWLLSGFILVYCNIHSVEMNEQLETISSFLKNGLNSKNACIAKSLGVLSRETCSFLNDKFVNSGQSNFISWFANLDSTQIDHFNLSIYERENIKQVSRKISPCSNKDQPTSFTFYIRGTIYNEDYKVNSLFTTLFDSLSLKRDEQNSYDPFAIFVLNGENILGYVPKEYSRYISTEMDLNDAQYNVEILTMNNQGDYNDIKVRAVKIE